MNKFLSKFKIKKISIKISKASNPHKHWAMLLWTFFILIICLIAFSFYLLFEIRNEQIFQVKPTIVNKKILLKENLLKTVSDLFEQKAKNESDLVTNPPHYQDPSI